MRRLLHALRAWRQGRQRRALERHQAAIAAQYAPRLSAYRSIVETAKAEERKVVPFLNLQLVRDKRRRVA